MYMKQKCVILYAVYAETEISNMSVWGSEAARRTEIGSFVSQISETAVNGSAVRVFLYNNYYRRPLCR